MKKIILILIIAILMMGCEANNENNKIEITVSAAASLKDALTEIAREYELENQNVKIVLNMAGSGTLAMQIEQGADVDLFFSAADSWMNGLDEKGLIITDTISPFLSNRMVFIVPDTSNYDETNFMSLFNDESAKIVVGEPSSVPAGKYAMEWLDTLGVMDTITKQLVYGKDVKEVLSWVETGNADAGIVYATDALASSKVKVTVTSVAGDHNEISYPAAIVKSSRHPDEAKAFLDYMMDSDVFENYGFSKSKREE
ncbi:MAG: molybdate ABC transporter substrate-binding protein [Clostridia bacterium]|nr:molybdate ABC transporter substrate-binding protein [Clostridia bacterium]